MANSVQTKREDITDQASTIAKDLKDVGAATKRIASDSVEAIRDTANDYLDQGKTKVRELGGTVQNKVQDQPLTAVLIAAAVGFLLGAVWVRR
jgi:ElaB/YqjD/DUF883 family membrane-anchored ribosome-binding protein